MNSSLLLKPRIGRQLAVGLLTAGVLSVGLAGPAAAAGANAVTSVPAFINTANQDSYTISGTAASTVAGVTVALEADGQSPVSGDATVSADGPAGKTWTATVDASGLTDTEGIRVLVAFDGVCIQQDAGCPADAVVTQDTLAPDLPIATPDDKGGVAYTTVQQVAIVSAFDPTDQGRTHYTVGTPTATDPTASDRVVPAQLTVDKTEQVKAVAFDAAGNPSEIMVMNYVVNLPAAATPPAGSGAGGGTGGGAPGGSPAPPVVVPPVVLPPVLTPALAKATLSATVSRQAVNVGTKVTMSGTVSPFKGVTLTLQRRIGTGAWGAVATKVIPTTAANGGYTFTVPTASSRAASYRVSVSGPGVASTSGTSRNLAVYRTKVTKVAAAGAENVSVRNTGKVSINLAGWKLRDRSGKTLALRSYTLKPGATVKVYTGSGAKAAGKLFLRKQSNVWGSHDTANLYDANGMRVASIRY